jgi:hypothetical protein
MLGFGKNPKNFSAFAAGWFKLQLIEVPLNKAQNGVPPECVSASALVLVALGVTFWLIQKKD